MSFSREKKGSHSFKNSSQSKPFGRRKPGSSQSNPNSSHQKSKRPIKKFDPSLFMKKVEEQVVSEAYVPKNTFADLPILDQIKQNIADKGYTALTPIQDQAIPLILQGKDVIASANTGTGKTAAFLIPLINHIMTRKIDRVLIVTPTRELANQIQEEFKDFAFKTNMYSTLCIGGLNIANQIRYLADNPEFVIGTPGRLIDLEKQGILNLSKYNAIVLDEVDTMVDMGFINDIKYMIRKLPQKRLSLFFSATIPVALKEVMSQFLKNPAVISVKTRQSAENVNQSVVKVDGQDKVELLHDLLIKPEFTRVIIFLRTRWAVNKLARHLVERGFEVASIHGDKTQAQRSKALSAFKAGRVRILLATDVVARGIDIDNVSHVINYDMPESHEDYIHRIGRTGRAAKIGQAITFVD